MIPARAALGEHQIIPAVVLVDVRPFGEDARLLQNFRLRPDELLRLRVVFLNDDTREAMPAFTKIPFHVYEPLAAIVIVKKRWVKADGVQHHRIAPRPANILRSREINTDVLERPSHAAGADVSEDEPELLVRMAVAWRPHAAGIHNAAQVEL